MTESKKACACKTTRLFCMTQISMKKLILLCSFLAIIITGFAKEVTGNEAKEYANAFMQARSFKTLSVQQVQIVGQQHYYLVTFAPQGWALISADDVVTPVIGYSLDGRLDMNRLPDNMQYMLGEYEQQIIKAISEENNPHPRWRTPQRVLTRASGVPVDPLIRVNWNQSKPYNVYCPQKEALVGCVAVAMGQAMSVQRYPSRPQGEISYTSTGYGGLRINFNDERAYNWDDIMSGANNNDETARLLYHAGMSVRMDYSEDGSGIPSNEVSRISTALRQNFSYSNDIQYIWREYYNGDWEQLLVNELNAGRAVVYNAVDTKNQSGHSFNVDGYDGEGHFHINWGWGGIGNGKFSVNALRDQYQGYDYDALHVVVIGIGAPDQELKSISLSNTRIEENLPVGAVVGNVLVNGENPKPAYQVSVHGTYDSGTGSYKAVPFTWENDMLKTTEVLSVAQANSREIEITVKDTESGSTLTQGFRITVDPWKSLEETTQLRYDRQLKVFTLTTKHNVSYTIISENNEQLSVGILEPLPELTVDANTLPAGKNVIELKCADEIKKFRIIAK